MIGSSRVIDRAFGEVKRLCYAGLDEPTLLKEATERVRRAVPFEYCVHSHNPLSGLIARSVCSGPEIKDKSPVFLGYVYLEDEVTPYDWMIRRRLAAITLSEATGGRLERALRYRELFIPVGFRHEARAVFALEGQLWGSIDALRERDSPDFTDREVAFLRRIGPHFAAGLKAAALRKEALAETDGDAAVPGVLVLDHKGRVVQHTQAAERWLRELENLAPGWLEADALPSAVSTVVGSLRRALGPGTDRDNNSVPRLLVRARSGRWLALHGARSESRSDDRTYETIIVIEPAGPGEVSWLRTSAYGLSGREREVVDLMVRGLSTKEISRTLHISDYTVQDHLSNVFDKVGVRGRRALIKRLYLDGLSSLA